MINQKQDAKIRKLKTFLDNKAEVEFLCKQVAKLKGFRTMEVDLDDDYYAHCHVGDVAYSVGMLKDIIKYSRKPKKDCK